MIYARDFIRHFEKEKIFTMNDAKRFMIKSGSTGAYTKLLIHNLLSAKNMTRINKGVYTFNKNEEVLGFAFSPFYYGLEYALTIRGLWTQPSSPVIITRTKSLPGVREIGGKRVVIRRVSKNMFFGFEYVRYFNNFVPVSDMEKTLIDFIYYRVGVENEEIKSLFGRADQKKLRGYAKKMKIVPNALKTMLYTDMK